MTTDFNRELCDERHKNIEGMLTKIDKNVDTLFIRLNWFFILAIATLVSAGTSIVLSVIPK
jgi:hypothetical protein